MFGKPWRFVFVVFSYKAVDNDFACPHVLCQRIQSWMQRFVEGYKQKAPACGHIFWHRGQNWLIENTKIGFHKLWWSRRLPIDIVTTNLWATVLCILAAEDACFRMRITLAVVLIRSLVFHVCVPVSECVCICWLKRNSSNLDRAPKMRDSVRLNSWDSSLLTLPSISSETCVIYSSLILGTDVFRDWPFLGFSSCVSPVTAANFRLFLSVAIFLKGKC